jgi:hypothetical protein
MGAPSDRPAGLYQYQNIRSRTQDVQTSPSSPQAIRMSVCVSVIVPDLPGVVVDGADRQPVPGAQLGGVCPGQLAGLFQPAADGIVQPVLLKGLEDTPDTSAADPGRWAHEEPRTMYRTGTSGALLVVRVTVSTSGMVL